MTQDPKGIRVRGTKTLERIRARAQRGLDSMPAYDDWCALRQPTAKAKEAFRGIVADYKRIITEVDRELGLPRSRKLRSSAKVRKQPAAK